MKLITQFATFCPDSENYLVGYVRAIKFVDYRGMPHAILLILVPDCVLSTSYGWSGTAPYANAAIWNCVLDCECAEITTGTSLRLTPHYNFY